MSRITSTTLAVYPSGSTPSTVTGGGSAWTYGTWVEVISSAPAALHLAGVVLSSPSGSNVQFEVEIGIGATIGVVSPLHAYRSFYESSTGETNSFLAIFPVAVPGVSASDKVWVRVRSSGSGLTAGISLLAYSSLSDTDHVATSGQTLFSVPTGANAISITPSGTAWAWSAWTEIWTGTTVETSILGVAARGPIAGVELEYEIGFGASSSEVGKTSFRTANSVSGAGALRFFPLPAPFPVPPNTRVSMRLRKTGTNTTVHSVAILLLNDTLTNTITANVNEAITVADVVSAQLRADLYVSAAETIAVSEAVTLRPSTILLQAYESVDIDDDPSIPLGTGLSDRVFVREYVALSPSHLVIVLSETITVAEGPLYRDSNGVTGALGTQPGTPTGASGVVDYWSVGL